MMGHRGCRLCVTYPEIAEMQTNAVIKAALKVSAETGKDDHPAHHDSFGWRGQGAQVRQGMSSSRPPTSSSLRLALT